MTKDEHLAACHKSPAFFVREMLGMKPTKQQEQVLNEMAYPGTKIAIASGHGIGKSTLLSWIALWFLATRDNAKIPCTAPTAHQLEDILWGELRAGVQKMHPWLREQFDVSKMRITMKGSNGFIVARTARAENPDALQGFHGEEMLFIIDEAAGVDEKIFEVAYGALSTPRSRAIMTGNPTNLSGFFYKTFHTENSWIKFQFSSADSDIVDHEFINAVKQDYGEDSDVYRVRVLGQFPRAGLSGIIPAHLVDAALSRGCQENTLEFSVPVLGVDPAWEGEDRSVVVLRRGRMAKVLLAQRHLSGDGLARHVMRFAAEHKSRFIFVDKTGVGASCCDFLRSFGVKHHRVSFADRPIGDMYLNKRAEIWWKLREWFQSNEVVLFPWPGIKEDLIAPEYGIKENGKIYLESKEQMRKKGTHSPDIADALALTFCLPDEYMTALRVNGKAERMNTFSSEWDNQHRKEALGGRLERAFAY